MSRFYRARGKRVLDLLLGGAALVILAPVIACVAVLVRVVLGSPVLFRQTRPGLRGEPFTLLKFRTMDGSARPGRATRCLMRIVSGGLGRVLAVDVARRAARAAQRRARRYEPGRSAAAADAVPRSLQLRSRRGGTRSCPVSPGGPRSTAATP